MTDKKFYKLDEFEGHLPNPKIFPTQGVDILAVKDCPNIFGDGFMLDLGVDKSEGQRLEKKAIRVVLKITVDKLVEDGKGRKILLSEPQCVYYYTKTAYVLTTSNTAIEPIGVQVKYYRYFRNRYPKCRFYTDGRPIAMLSIRNGRKLVGLCMPIALPKMEVNDE